ncbi:hypothetical protein K438DRAFT_1971734 [Mycena galopus ATCC 62051]|nr:hypothetical protein K438DRAFT_1971734 [Mycena galopus ATCC 62051]
MNLLRIIQRLQHPLLRIWALIVLHFAFTGNLYEEDGEGDVYVAFRFSPTYLGRFQAGTLTQHDTRDHRAWEAKIGHTDDLFRRMGQYRPCDPDGQSPVVFVGHCHVRHRMVAERLIHLVLTGIGAHIPPYPCPGCGVSHREYFSVHSAGGFTAILAIIQSCVELLGDHFEL